ncbi:unnamed protein product [Penicillium nalgiovense]|uniref:Uncharacterized protein n=1 Tax=Penicillium nalgiovense TaxID=60175 RepID=A0A1V6Z3N9_PENNA|nr:hypothetical protein PENNAL_c0004G03083 [Penicillium nalgiovense]CAG7948123.1 unnamed protein product [Penicillium nalgiovense]CAG8026811.1 unnamed protein product [Penicillium nalgiovense]CAG8035554.1 unnamed protein product [Penicillium nalgiovense]CAG8039141.1 unnamed protein product [Penicillium nalgiovense]
MSEPLPTRPWPTLSAIDGDYESGILYEEERQQWLRQHPHVVPQTAKRSRNKNQRAFPDRGPSMAKGLRGIAERGAARRNETAMNKNDVFTKPLPPIPPQEAPQPATTVGQDDVSQGLGRDINKMSVYYVLNRTDMQGHHDNASFAQKEASEPAIEVGQKAVGYGSVHSSEKMKPNLLLKECKLQGYDDETPSIQPSGSEPLLPPFSYHDFNAQASYDNDSSDFHRLAHATPSAGPTFEAPDAQASTRPPRYGYSSTSWYEASPTGQKSSPDSQGAVARSATPVPEIKQEDQPNDVEAAMDKLIAYLDQQQEKCRLAIEKRNAENSSSAYRFAPPNSASTDIYHADQHSGYQTPDFVIRKAEGPLFVSPDPAYEVTTTRRAEPRSPVYSPTAIPSPCLMWSPSPVSSHYPLGYWSSNESETTASPEFETDRGCSASDAPLQESPTSPAPAPPSPERRPSDIREYSYAGAPRVGIDPSDVPQDPRLTDVTFRPDYVSSSTSGAWFREYRAAMGYVEVPPLSLETPQSNLTENKTTFDMNVPIHNISQHQTTVHGSESTNGEHSCTASIVCEESNASKAPSNATMGRVTQSPDAYNSEDSEGSRGTKRRRFTKNLFGKKGYLDDNEEPRDRKFRRLKEAIGKGHSTIGSIKGMIWDDNRALIGSSKPGIVTENTAPITLNTDMQSILYAEMENMITHAANEFLMKEYYDGRLTDRSLEKVKKRWGKKHMPGVPEFRFDQTTQHKIIKANRKHLQFGQISSSTLDVDTILADWRRNCKNMSIRTFVSPDSVIKKQIHDILNLLELLKGDECHIELIMALNAHVRGELKKHEIMKKYRDAQNSRISHS